MVHDVYRLPGRSKIAILTPTFLSHSGIDRVVELQAKEFLKSGHSVTIITLKAGIKIPGVSIVEIGMPASAFSERMFRLFFFLKRGLVNRYSSMLKDMDIVISHFYPMNVIAERARSKFGVRYVYYNHGVATPSLFGLVGGLYMRYFRWLNNSSAKRADAVVSISQYLRKIFLSETGRDSTVILNQIDTERFHSGVSGKKIRSKLNLGDDPVILYVGRLSPHKGVHYLISAFDEIVKEIPNARLVIAGKPTFDDYFNKLKKMANDRVMFSGFVEDSDLPLYYAMADVYATGTLWEGFNMTLVEAQKCGTPVVAFNIGPHPEVVKKGKLVAEADVHAMAKAMLSYLKK